MIWCYDNTRKQSTSRIFWGFVKKGIAVDYGTKYRLLVVQLCRGAFFGHAQGLSEGGVLARLMCVSIDQGRKQRKGGGQTSPDGVIVGFERLFQGSRGYFLDSRGYVELREVISGFELLFLDSRAYSSGFEGLFRDWRGYF